MKGKKLKYGILCLGCFVFGGFIVAAFYNFNENKPSRLYENISNRKQIMHDNDNLILTQYLKN